MPVTARLSKRFYEVLGEDVANELVDWFNAVELQTEFRTGLHGLRADLLRWMFGFWATTLLTLAGLIIAVRGL